MLIVVFVKVIKTIKRIAGFIDESIMNNTLKKLYNKYFKYRGKVCRLSGKKCFPPYASANANYVFGPFGRLLAVGGDLSPDRMLVAYKKGILNFSYKHDPLLWWTADIRCIIFPREIHVPKNIKPLLRNNKFSLTVDKCFKDLVRACAESRNNTWLTDDKMEAFGKLYEMGYAHSVEVWQDEKLAGGLFGVCFGGYFMVESMVSLVKHSSKVALVTLALRLSELNFVIIDCGFWPTEHLKSMGAVTISQEKFLELISQGVRMPGYQGDWTKLFGV
jgi:leucyl/phenylalanyl-tRNA--protein transferase